MHASLEGQVDTSVHGRRSLALRGLLVLVPVLCAGCASYKVLAFKVAPPVVCQGGGTVDVSWEVKGKTALKADPAPNGWDENVSSKDEKKVNVSKDTKFTIVALESNPAKGESHASQTVQVAPDQNQAAPATCDDDGNCTGEMHIAAGGTVKVQSLAKPSMKFGMKVKPHKVCVTPPGAARVCLDPETASVPIDVKANGTWKLDAKLEADETALPPPQLRLVFDYGC